MRFPFIPLFEHSELPMVALVGAYDYDVNMVVWVEVDMAHGLALVQLGVWEDRGYRVVNGVYQRLFYLPSPTIT